MSADPSTTTREVALSVIVIFHDRLEYVRLAVDSVLKQAAETPCEILVVGPLLPPQVGSLVNSGSITFVECTGQSIGSKIARGIEAASGTVLAFLEDDDLFAGQKLRALRSAFLSHPRLGYFQNGYELIDAEGAAYGGPYYKLAAMRRWSATGTIEVNGDRSPGQLRRLSRAPFSHNLSSISVRRELVRGHVHLIEKVGYPVDLCLFALALASESCQIVLDPTRLTRLRIHPTSLSNPRSGGNGLESHLVMWSELNWEGRHVVQEFVDSSGSGAVRRAWQGVTAVNDLNHYLRKGSESRTPLIRSLVTALGRLETFAVRPNLGIVALALLSVCSPRLGTRAFHAFRTMLVGQS